jgi:hypothetical protein
MELLGKAHMKSGPITMRMPASVIPHFYRAGTTSLYDSKIFYYTVTLENE